MTSEHEKHRDVLRELLRGFQDYDRFRAQREALCYLLAVTEPTRCMTRCPNGTAEIYERDCQAPDCLVTEAEADDRAVDLFVAAMKRKMAEKRGQGKSGWQNQARLSAGALQGLLVDHLAKGDPVDVGNFAMMLRNRGERTNEFTEQLNWVGCQECDPTFRCHNGKTPCIRTA